METLSINSLTRTSLTIRAVWDSLFSDCGSLIEEDLSFKIMYKKKNEQSRNEDLKTGPVYNKRKLLYNKNT